MHSWSSELFQLDLKWSHSFDTVCLIYLLNNQYLGTSSLL